MTILRILFLLLLVANLILGVLNLSRFSEAPNGEPDRLAKQLHPEKMRLLPGGAARKASSAQEAPKAPEPSAPVETSAPRASAPAAPAASLVATMPPAPGCVAWNGLNRTQADQIKARAKLSKFGVREHASGSGNWWVHLPAEADREAADKRSADLTRQGIKNFVSHDPGSENAISLGLFKTEQAARRMQEDLKSHGVEGAQVTMRETAASTLRIEVTGSADQLSGFSSEMAASLPIGVSRSNCTPER